MTSRRMLILDFDGVLVDSEPVHFESWNQAFDELLGIRVEGGHHALVGLTLNQIYQLWAQNRVGLELSTELKQQLLVRKTELFFSIGAERLQPMPGSVELIQRAQSMDWYVAVASRSRRQRLHRTLELIRMPPLFDVVLGSEDMVDAETEHKVHARAARMFDIDPAVCVAVEDSASGVADAYASGVGRVIGFTSSFDEAALMAAGAHEIVHHLGDVQL